MSKSVLEKAAMAMAAIVIVSATWFWIRQIDGVLTLLEMAYG